MPSDSTQKTLLVAVVLCLVCSVIVSTAAVALKPRQERNRALDRQKNILEVAGLLEEGKSTRALFEQIDTRIVDLETGAYVGDIDPQRFDQRQAAKDPERNVRIPRDEDIANIKQHARYAKIYIVEENGAMDRVVLPVHGQGLWSTLYGFVAVEEDGNTIAGLKFYEHAETPGLGGEIDNPKWRRQWAGKLIYGEADQPRIEVVRANVDVEKPEAKYQVDGIAGATLTSRGVMNLLRYWFSDQGFGPYLERLRSEGG
ncbi:MAG: Na(+)-translocating NADH-quinone reductase subunit C [Gammaproteobacteria bacterium]|nr:Na(+)-translocating NADH-quinone reductase subunit C [Gammaproteobacteria bacterium]NIR83343.1 Na(+)-translocating NADH-quinone reductase subunit C [Gammaproteobacteria bacterium]NIR91143.1 Na(+)-translocating NADH-quinone reductase subunit C [Gammaproteobacteria bacterium]NIU04510.1 Na(+)-translocating NADH-quinone reductase subunit C [Gammaproteobacteria bacterium]NIW87146.1 Na(+)-translocating NADH-quinone reductase subunit C [Gammaproteobacteria bacterium]